MKWVLLSILYRLGKLSLEGLSNFLKVIQLESETPDEYDSKYQTLKTCPLLLMVSVVLLLGHMVFL